MINGRLFVVVITHPSACRLAAVISHSPLRLAGLTHLKLLSKFKISKARFMLKSRCTGLWRLGLFAEVRLWRQYPLVEEIIYIDMFKSLHDSTTSFISDFGCIIFFLLSLVLSINSPNATSLHSRCIWEGVLRYKSQEVKGSLVFSYSRVLYSIYCPLGLIEHIKPSLVSELQVA